MSDDLHLFIINRMPRGMYSAKKKEEKTKWYILLDINKSLYDIPIYLITRAQITYIYIHWNTDTLWNWLNSA